MYCEKVTSCCPSRRKGEQKSIKKGIKQEIVQFTSIKILN